jgi:micrococcal nuclease
LRLLALPLAFGLALAALAGVTRSAPAGPSPAASPATAPVAALEGPVVRVVDGDTIHVKLGDRTEKVRYIGVNTPEVHHPTKGEEPGGREAARVNAELVAGQRVRLELDAQARDRYGRVLAYVWVGDLMINAELVCRGYAQVMTVPPNVRHQALFLRLQREAREAGRGLWARSPGAPASLPAEVCASRGAPVS